jgi:hypothetical protein
MVLVELEYNFTLQVRNPPILLDFLQNSSLWANGKRDKLCKTSAMVKILSYSERRAMQGVLIPLRQRFLHI